MGFLDTLRQRNMQLDGATAPTGLSPGVVSTEPAKGAPAKASVTRDYAKTAQENFGFTGWNPDNLPDYSNIMAQANALQERGGGEAAGIRDYLQGQFNSYYEPIAANFRQQMAARGTPADATDANLMQSPELQAFARTGRLPDQPLTQQWIAQGNQTATAAQPSTDPRRQMIFDEIMRRFKENEGVPGRDNPAVRGQADVFAAEQERARRDYLADLAEREGPNANLRGEQRMAMERMGRDTGAFEAELINRELANRRGIQQSSLDSAVRLLDTDSQQALARELGLSDLDLRRTQLGQSNDQFLRELALREWDLLNRNDILRRGL